MEIAFTNHDLPESKTDNLHQKQAVRKLKLCYFLRYRADSHRIHPDLERAQAEK